MLPEWHLQSFELSGAVVVGGVSVNGKELREEKGPWPIYHPEGGGPVYSTRKSSSSLKPESRAPVDVSRRRLLLSLQPVGAWLTVLSFGQVFSLPGNLPGSNRWIHISQASKTDG